MQARSRTLMLITLWLLVALAVRLVHISRQSIWFDEGWSAYAATTPGLIAAAAADATNPPLYYILLNAHAALLGDSAFSLRLFSTFAGLLGVALAYRLGAALFGRRAGLYTLLLATCSPLLWWAAQEARMYTLLALLVLVAALAWHRLLARPTRWAWLALWAAELALLYTHNTGPVAALWLNAVTLLAWAIRRRADQPRWQVWIAGQGLVGLLWLPYFVSRFVGLSEANSAVSSAPQLSLALVGDIWSAFWAGSWALVREPLFATVTTAAPYVGLSAVTLALALLVIPWRSARARWLVAHAIMLTAGLLLGLVVLGNELHGRYLVMVTPLLLVPIGAGLARLRPRALRWGGAAVFVAIFALAVVANQNPLYGHDDVRGTVAYYAETLGPDDSVAAWSYADRYELAYYWPRLGVQAARITLPEGADLETVLPLLPDSGDVALNVWYTQRADYRGMLNCVLAHGTRTLPDAFTTYGMTSLVYRDAAINVPQMTPHAADFGVARLLSTGTLPAFTSDQALCLPVEIELAHPTMADLQAAVVVRNRLGWEVAHADAIFATANQRTSSMVNAGAILAAYPLVRLPFGAPSGDYTLALRVYDPLTLSGHEVATDGGRSRELPLGTWSVPRGQDWEASGRQPDELTPLDLTVGGLALRGADLPADGETLVNGQTLMLTLLWQGTGDLPVLTLAATDGGWSIDLPPSDRDEARVTLDWRETRIPADATSGSAELRLPDGRVLARFSIEALPYLTDAPPVETPFTADIPGLGALVGYTLGENPVSLADAVALTLVWRAGDAAPSATSYTVFAQLVTEDGQLIAQSDALPDDGNRPTTGWRPGEIIVDEHRLRFNEAAQPGPTRLIVGFYDAATGERLSLDADSDAITLPARVDVTR